MPSFTPVSRRGFLMGSTLAAGAALLGFQELFGAHAQDSDDDAATILNLAATAETLACTHYYNVLAQNKITFSAPQISYLRAALESELTHLEFLNANGGKSQANEFYFPDKVFTDGGQFTAYTEIAENAFIGAYLAAVRRFAELNQPLLAATAAQVAAVEAQHLALVRQIGGELPNNQTLVQAKYFKVSDVVSTITSFLQGSKDFSPNALAYPGADAIRKQVGTTNVIVVKPFVDLTQFDNGQATLAATRASTQASSAPTAAATTAR